MADTTAVEKFLDAIVSATIPACDAWSADATLDATVPNWRLHASGADAIRAEYARWFADPARFEEMHRYSVDGGAGEVVEYTLSWSENGVRSGGFARPGGCALLMRDVTPWLVPATDEPVEPGQHERFLHHMAALHAEFWECGPDFDVVPAMHRYLELSPWTAAAEAAAGSAHLVPQLVAKGWPLLAEVAPAVAEVLIPLAHDPGPLVEALATTPQTFVHSNWKLDNLGTDDAGRTVVLDWEQPGRGAALSDLAWYPAINCRRLPASKEASIEVYRSALEACGIDTEPWWDRQLALCLLGAMVLFGWEKALGGYDEELAWWETKIMPGPALLN